jgi:hypothetical protein
MFDYSNTLISKIKNQKPYLLRFVEGRVSFFEGMG